MRKDLIVVSPDGPYATVMDVFLRHRRRSLRIRDVQFDIKKDPLHDSSPVAAVADLLRGYSRTHDKAIVLRDLEGSGCDNAKDLAAEIDAGLCANGWGKERVATIVVQPEIEIWLRFDTTHMRELLEENARRDADMAGLLFSQVVNEAVRLAGGERPDRKPQHPKEAFEMVLRRFAIPRSAFLYGELARRESLDGCQIESFRALVGTLRKWFSER
jgi:hypothetical protein